MDVKTILLDLLLGGFFAVACVKAHGPFVSGQKATLGSFFRLSDRLERLKRSRWQWFSMVAILLVLRTQQNQPLSGELMVAFQFLVFLALPTQPQAAKGSWSR